MNIFKRINHTKKQSQKGFTLIELLLVIGLMSTLLIILTDMFTSVLDVKTESEANAGVTEDGRYLLSRLEYDIKRAQAVTTPEHLEVQATNISSSGATITWNTLASSDSQVEYGQTESYGQTTTLDPSLVTSHSVNLSGLTNDTVYHFRVHSRDAAGNLTSSADYTFVTSEVPAINFVQSSGAFNDGYASSINVVFVSTTTNNLMVVAVSYENPQPPTCSDTQGNTYSLATHTYDSVSLQSLAVCYAYASSDGWNRIDVNFASTAYFRRIIAHEYSGVTMNNPVDAVATRIAKVFPQTDAITSGSAITTVDGNLIFGVVNDVEGLTNITAGTGFTQRHAVSGDDLATQDLVQPTAGSIASTQSFNDYHRYIAHMVAFKAIPNESNFPPQLGTTSNIMNLDIGGENYLYELVDGNLQLTNSLGTHVLNSSRTTISDLTFQHLGQVDGQNSVRMSFTATSKAQTDAGQISRTFSTNIGARQ